MNQTWLPSQTGPTVLIATRRLDVGLGDEGQDRGDAHVEAVGHREADEQHAKQDPPDQAQRLVGEE